MRRSDVFNIAVSRSIPYLIMWSIFLLTLFANVGTSVEDVTPWVIPVALVLLCSWGLQVRARVKDFEWAYTILDVPSSPYSYISLSDSRRRSAILRVYETLRITRGGRYVLGRILPAPVRVSLVYGFEASGSTRIGLWQRVLLEAKYWHKELPK